MNFFNKFKKQKELPIEDSQSTNQEPDTIIKTMVNEADQEIFEIEKKENVLTIIFNGFKNKIKNIKFKKNYEYIDSEIKKPTFFQKLKKISIIKKKTNKEQEENLVISKGDFSRNSNSAINAASNINHVSSVGGVERVSRAYNPTSQDSFILSDDFFKQKNNIIPIVKELTLKNQYKVGAISLAIGVLIGSVGYYQNLIVEQNRNKKIQITTQLIGDVQRLENVIINSKALNDDDKLNSHMMGIFNSYKKLSDLIDLNQENKTIVNYKKEIGKNLDIINSNIKNKEKSINEVNAESAIKNIEDVKNKLDLFKNEYEKNIKVDSSLNLLNDMISNLNTVLQIFKNANNDKNMNNSLSILNDNLKKLSIIYNGDKKLNIPSLLESGNNLETQYLDLANSLLNQQKYLNTEIKKLNQNQNGNSNSKVILDLDKNLQNILSITQATEEKNINKIIFLIGLSWLILSILFLVYVYMLEKNNNTQLEKAENAKNQNAIFKLLSEIIPLSAGDLTKKTTVEAQITGPIADAINSTIESLAGLVRKIKNTTILMKQKTTEVKDISEELLKTNEEQAKNITSTGFEVIEVSKAIEEISIKTEKSAKAAEKSLKVSEIGVKSVNASVESMQAINENMNDTVRLMDKVENSSKQISEIVELLSDITEETSVLASNATIQAVKAGEFGKGFKVVADSIQELADKASEAARKVGGLIANVQTDIQAVGYAVEKTTLEVEKGVKLSEDAGKSLKEISEVSKELAEEVSAISIETKAQAETSRKITENMKDILQKTEETKKSTEKTVESISEIAKISNSLGDSVQSFTVD